MQTKLAPLYVLINDVKWLQPLAKAGVKCMQLRLKDKSEAALREQIKQAIRIAKTHDVTLIINDYWQLAIEYGAAWVHLGQEDLIEADMAAIKQAGIKIGISTHTLDELEIALGQQPDYIALGPMFTTTTKVVNYDTQGLKMIDTWRTHMPKDMPLVCIGGIDLEAAKAMWRKAAIVAVQGAILNAEDPLREVEQWLSALRTVC